MNTPIIRYKLTDANMRSNNGKCQWKLGERKTVRGNLELCVKGFHYYQHPLLAVLHNPIHGDYDPQTMRLFKCEVSGKHLDEGQMKGCCSSMTLIEEIPVPLITLEQKIKYGIYVSLEVYHDPKFIQWAENWLSGKNRSAEAAWSAARAAAGARAVVRAAVKAVEWAARAAGADINLIELAERAMK